jgi:hypothetical protein
LTLERGDGEDVLQVQEGKAPWTSLEGHCLRESQKRDIDAVTQAPWRHRQLGGVDERGKHWAVKSRVNQMAEDCKELR